jgi:hypothetical protein
MGPTTRLASFLRMKPRRMRRAGNWKVVRVRTVGEAKTDESNETSRLSWHKARVLAVALPVDELSPVAGIKRKLEDVECQ